ncbi:MAG: histidinol dehydrogenase [Hellea sp.]|nr:histidinol dehydrogenase [Hellea sp.]
MEPLFWDRLSKDEQRGALSRPAGLTDNAVQAAVDAIMDAVQARGDAAVLEYTRKFDAPDLTVLNVSLDDCEAAWNGLPIEQQEALKVAKANVETFHFAQMPESITTETMPGVECRREPRALKTVGLYVPGGTAPLVSTTIMLAVPAKVAGCKQRIMVSPPGKDGNINAAVLAAAYLCDVTAVFACGGAQAIAALTYGTGNIPRCDKIFGPGNAYVAAAKSKAAQISGGPAIDLPAGPSEAMVIADATSNPTFVASDLLSQAEHDRLAQVICVAADESSAEAISNEVERQLKTLPRADIAREAINNSRMIITDDLKSIHYIIESYAPEHVILQNQDADKLAETITNAGSVFIGPWTPESVGDYASGTNHTLPTYGAARNYSGVTLESYFKYVSFQKLTKDGMRRLGPIVELLADMEGLDAHKRAVSFRLEALK